MSIAHPRGVSLPDDLSPWLTVDEATTYLQITRRTLDRWRNDGRLTAYRFGPRAVRFKRTDLDAMAEPVAVTRA